MNSDMTRNQSGAIGAALTSDEILLMHALDPDAVTIGDEQIAREKQLTTDGYARQVENGIEMVNGIVAPQISGGSGPTGGFAPLLAGLAPLLPGLVGGIISGITDIFKAKGRGIAPPNARGGSGNELIKQMEPEMLRREMEIRNLHGRAFWKAIIDAGIDHVSDVLPQIFPGVPVHKVGKYAEKAMLNHIPESFIRYVNTSREDHEVQVGLVHFEHRKIRAAISGPLCGHMPNGLLKRQFEARGMMI